MNAAIEELLEWFRPAARCSRPPNCARFKWYWLPPQATLDPLFRMFLFNVRGNDPTSTEGPVSNDRKVLVVARRDWQQSTEPV